MTSLPSFFAPTLDSARPDAPLDAPNPLVPTPPDAASPASPFGLAIQQALSDQGQPAAEGDTTPRESADPAPAAPDAGQCPAWACLLQVAPAPVPNLPPPQVSATREQAPRSAELPPLPGLPAGVSSSPVPATGPAEASPESPAHPALTAALTPKPHPETTPKSPPISGQPVDARVAPKPGTRQNPIPNPPASSTTTSGNPAPAPASWTPLSFAGITGAGSSAAGSDRQSDLIASPLPDVLPAEDPAPLPPMAQDANGQGNLSSAPHQPGFESSPFAEGPPTPVSPVVNAASSPREPASPTERPATLPARSGPDSMPAPATFTPPPGKNVTGSPGNRPILSPAKDGTMGAQLTGVTMPQAQTSTAPAETGRMLPTSGTGTVPAVSSSTASTSGMGLSPELTEEFGPEARGADSAPGQAAASFTPAFLSDRLAPLDAPADLRESGAPAPSPAATLERLEVQLRERVVEFRERRLDTLSVVLRPDAGTELHLQLRLHGQQVEVLAHCPRGDAAGLQSQWHQLQQSLASQGVRLAGLETGTGDSRRQPAPPPPPSEPAGAPAPSTHPRTGHTLPARPSTASRRLLESWA